MATGIPSKNGNGSNQALELTYPNKKSVSDILNAKIATRFDLLRKSNSINRLYCADNLAGLRHLLDDSSVRGKVTLVYIDPPFATRGTFHSRKQQEAYADNLCGAEYVESLRERLVLLRELLSPMGSIYLHLDENMIFQMKLIMDEVFGAANYRNLIVRKKCNPKNYTRKAYGNIADYILFYTRGERYVWNRPVEPLSDQSFKEYQYVEPGTGRRFMKVPVHAPGIRNGATGGLWRGKMPPPGKHWQYTPDTLDEMDARGEIYWSGNGNPRRKVYLDQHSGVGIQDIWLDYKDAHNQNIKITGYPTEKNPDLLRRIIEASSNIDDIVLDCYAGSGTTLDVANDLQRRWIGVDSSTEAIATILERFQHGLSAMGDYVKKQNIPAGEGKLNQPSLFGSLEDVERSIMTKDQPTRKPIVDFSLYIQKDKQRDYFPVVEKWIQRYTAYKDEGSRNTPEISEGVNIADVCYQLHKKDKKLAAIIDRVGPCNLKVHPAGFDFLVDAIVSQQLSKKAADTIIHRLRRLFRASRPTPKTFIAMPRSKITDAGVSERKYNYILDLAQHIQGSSINLASLADKSNEIVRAELKKVNGIGDWTVDMYLLFGLGRLDVFPLHDLALRKSMTKVYNLDITDFKSMEKIATRWKPFRSVGSWYLYRNANS
jgi:adenine-specific DNA-methyltransferase